MVATTELTSTVEKKYSMKEKWLWYIAGAFDTAGTITTNISKNKNCAVDYEMKPRIVFSRNNEISGVLGMFDEYCEQENVVYRFEETESSTRLISEHPESIQNFLTPIMGGFIQQNERAEIMVDELAPALKDGTPSSKEKFVDVMELVDKLHDKPIKGRRTTKYNTDYFRDEWNLE